MPSKSLFTIVVDPEKMNPFFRGTAIENSSEPARLMMEKVFEKFKDIDNNFVEQFQTTGFDARIFELYLFEYFSSSGFEVKRDFERPDFIISKDGVEVAIEATTTNPDPNYKKDHKSIEKILSLSDEDVERKENDEVPIRLGSSLFSKLDAIVSPIEPKELLQTISAKFSELCASDFFIGFISKRFTFIPLFAICQADSQPAKPAPITFISVFIFFILVQIFL